MCPQSARVWEYGSVPVALALVLLLTLAPWPAPAASETETVTLLVEDDESSLASGRAGDSSFGWRRVEVAVTAGVEQAIAQLETETGSRVVEEQSYELFAPQDEPLFGDQWHLENTGQNGATPDADIDAVLAWSTAARGEGVVVAVVDSGVDPIHLEFFGRLHPDGYDFVDMDNDPSPANTNQEEMHGTAVAGVIAAPENGIGITGVAPAARILAIRSCEEGSCSNFDVAYGIIYAVDEGADIINLSLGRVTPEDPVMEDAIAYARSRDVLVVTAAGNQTIDLDDLAPGEQLVPGGLPYSNILNVAASSDRDFLSGFSNYGPNTVDIAAPGEDIWTTGADGDQFGYWLGTSFSAPIVAGVAALLLSADPGIGHQEIIARITGFVDLPSGVAGATASGRVNAGRTLTRRFVDTASSVFVNAIDWLAAEAITEGCNPPQNHRFCPGDSVTRGQMAVFLSRAFDLPAPGTDHFSDDNGTFYEGAANRLFEAGLTVGCGGSRYCGEDDISRGEMAAMLARALSLPPTGTDHFDDDNGSTFENAINKVAEAGITVGCNPPANNNYCPTSVVNRGQMSAFIKRSVELNG
jgi:hypothetical protein